MFDPMILGMMFPSTDFAKINLNWVLGKLGLLDRSVEKAEAAADRAESAVDDLQHFVDDCQAAATEATRQAVIATTAADQAATVVSTVATQAAEAIEKATLAENAAETASDDVAALEVDVERISGEAASATATADAAVQTASAASALAGTASSAAQAASSVAASAMSVAERAEAAVSGALLSGDIYARLVADVVTYNFAPGYYWNGYIEFAAPGYKPVAVASIDSGQYNLVVTKAEIQDMQDGTYKINYTIYNPSTTVSWTFTNLKFQILQVKLPTVNP